MSENPPSFAPSAGSAPTGPVEHLLSEPERRNLKSIYDLMAQELLVTAGKDLLTLSKSMAELSILSQLMCRKLSETYSMWEKLISNNNMMRPIGLASPPGRSPES